jgi:hypothetical protein
MAAKRGGEVVAAIFLLKNCDPVEWKAVKYAQQHRINLEKLTTAQLQAIAAGANPADVGVIEAEFTRDSEHARS